MNIQRGLSGTLRRTNRITSPSSAPSPNAIRQPRLAEKMFSSSRISDRPEPEDAADPERAVDRQVDLPAHARGDQLVDRRVDRRVLAADAGAGDRPADH